ncbi:MAG TPA: 6-phosphogluconolactonase [Jatrophihabitans sp.]|jgi:6-phosphogluconolactonase
MAETIAAEPEHVVFETADELVAQVVARFVTSVSAAIAEKGRAAVALTAGSIMEQVWATLAASAADLDWASVDVFWGDERFVPSDSPDRNDVPAEKLLFAAAPFSAARRFSMPSAGGEFGEDLDAAARGYAETLQTHRRPSDTGEVPTFDVVLLGVGPDGHCCSLFPDHPSARDLSATVIPVRESPKPPPLRLSLSFEGLNTAAEIWPVVSGSGKADAVAAALGGADREHVPSAGARGRVKTLWMLDAEAAAGLT